MSKRIAAAAVAGFLALPVGLALASGHRDEQHREAISSMYDAMYGLPDTGGSITDYYGAARPTPTPTPSPAWTPAPAPASMMDYEYSTLALRSLWDVSTQLTRNDLCAKDFYMKYKGFDDAYDDQAVADFKAKVC